jgi:hypothetical protein
LSKAVAKPRKVPKRIGGVKVPKRLRRSAEPLLALADKPLVSDTVAAALLAAAAALVDKKDRKGVAKAAGLGAGLAAVKASQGANRLGTAALIALAEVAVGAAVKRVGQGGKPRT